MSKITMSRTWQSRIDHGRGVARRLGLAAVVLGALIGFAAGVKVFLVGPHPNDAEVTAAAFRVANQRDAAGQFAANFVAAVLSTPESRRPVALQRFITLPRAELVAQSAPAADPAPAVIDTPRVVSVSPAGSVGDADLYSAIVMLQQRAYAGAAPTVAFYRVPVSIWHYGARAMDMPTPISDPGPGADIALGYDQPLSPSSPVYGLLSGFVSTYLTATSGLDRYVVADSWIRPIGGYQSAVITSAAAATAVPDQPAPGTQVHIRLTVTAQTSQFARITFAFPLTVENSGGTWMVADLDSAPQTADAEATPAGQPQP